MEGAPKRQVNAEDMLAELKRALESSTPAPDAQPPSASTAPASTSPGRDNRRSQIDKESDRPVKAKADRSIGQPANLQKSAGRSSRRWTLTAGAIALAGAAVAGTGFALMNKAPDLPEREPSAAATVAPVRSQNEPMLKPSSNSGSLIEGGRQAAPLQAGASQTLPDAIIAPANDGSASAQGKAGVDTPPLTSTGLELAAPGPGPLNSAAVWVPAQRIGLDGKPIAPAPSTPASTNSAPPPAQTPKTAVLPAAPQMAKPDKAPIATAPPAQASIDSAPLPPEAPKPAAPQMVKPDKASVAIAPPTRPSTDSPPPAQTPKPNATRTASVPSESAEPSTPKIDSRKKPSEKPSERKPAKSAKASAKSVHPAERQSTEPAPPKEAERPPEPPQGAGIPTAAAPVKAPSVQQRVADGVTHAFGYLVHLPGALVPHFGGSNPAAQ